MNYLEKYSYTPDESRIASNLDSIASNLDAFASEETYKKCFSVMDLTTLRTNDTPDYVKLFVEKVNGLQQAYPAYPLPASVCVYPNLAETVARTRNNPQLHVTVVSSCFPSAQSFIEVKELECALAVRNGAEEIDIVLALNSFLEGDGQKAFDEIVRMKQVIDSEAAKLGRKVVLKVILETGLLVSLENIANASFLAMEAGADFIKTSTGKVDVNATPAAAFVMCECIAAYYKASGRKVGFKAAGGISTAKDALCYYSIVANVLGHDWLDKSLFRLGVSRLGNSLISAIEQTTVKYF